MDTSLPSGRNDDETTSTVAAEPQGSTPLIPNPATAHVPEPVPSTFHPHNLFL